MQEEYPKASPATSGLEAALKYAQQEGWEIFPVPPGTRKSYKAAEFSGGRPWGKTTDPNEIKRDFARRPDANVGIATGKDSGIFVVDIDTPEGHGVDGFASLRKLEAQYGQLPFTRMAESPSAGLHLYFRHPRDRKIKNSTSEIAEGIDVRGDGGMVIAPPSIREDGIYRWLNEDAPIADAPAWLVELVMEQPRERTDRQVVPYVKNYYLPAHMIGMQVPDYMLSGSGIGISTDPNDRLDTSVEKIKAALAVIDPDLPRANWIAIGCGLFKALGDEEGFEVWHEWSKKGSKYPGEREIGKQWDSIVKADGYGWTIATLFWLADEADPDWRNSEGGAIEVDPDWEQKIEALFGESKEQPNSGNEDTTQSGSDPPPQKEDDQTNDKGDQQTGDATKDDQSDSQPQTEGGDDGNASSSSEEHPSAANGGDQTKSDGEQQKSNGQQKPTIIITLADWLTRTLEPPDFLLGQWLSNTSRVLLDADTGVGKSIWTKALALRASAGKEFMHWKGVRPCRVLFVDGEMARRVTRQRLVDEVARLGCQPEGMHILSHEDMPAGTWHPLNTPAGQSMIDRAIAHIGGADLVIFDNIMALVQGDQKDEEGWRQVSPWALSLTRRRIGQLWLHHTGHDTSRGYGTKTREWQMDTVIHLDHIERSDADVSFQLTFHKAREREPATRKEFEDVKVALVNNQWTWQVSSSVGQKKVSPLGEKFYEALCFATESAGQQVNGNPAASLEAWRISCNQRGLLDQSKPNSARTLFSKHRLQLIAANWIGSNETTAWTLARNPQAGPF